MSKISRSILQVFAGGAKSFARFPASLTSALVIAVSASILIQLDYVTRNKFYESLQLAFLLTALLGMAIAVIGVSRQKAPLRFTMLNLGTLGVGVLLFLLINSRPGDIPSLTVARITAGSAILFLLFLLLISRTRFGSDYNQASFMTLKSAMIALLYALVILLGLYFIAFSVQSLLYKEMSNKVYQHIAVWSALLWFAFFLGYFPDFSPNVSDPQLEIAKKQPRFIEILFVNVLIPLITALTAVLLIWTVQILAVREWPNFTQLTTIFSAYAIVGIFLFVMVSQNTQPIARWFRRLYPLVLLLFLAFEAYAIIDRVRMQSFKTSEYFVSLIWIYALLSALILVFVPVVCDKLTAMVAILLITVSVLPIIGYQGLTIAAQASRLFTVLTRNQMIVNDRIQSAPATISAEDKTIITDSATFLLRISDVKKAPWFDSSISDYSQFSRVFGFNETYPSGPPNGEPVRNSMYLSLPQGTIDLSGYNFAVKIGDMNPSAPIEIKGKNGIYAFSPVSFYPTQDPILTVMKDGKELFKQDMKPFLDNLYSKYVGYISKGDQGVLFEEMVLKIENNGVKLMIVFRNIEISALGSSDVQYNVYLDSIYLGEP